MNRTPLGVGAGIFFFGLLLMIPTLSVAQTFPTKPINLMIGYAPGGGVDLVVRSAAAAAEKHLGHPFILNNRGGGGRIDSPESHCQGKTRWLSSHRDCFRRDHPCPPSA